MCDTIVRVLSDRVLFAKNSDRDANEAQVLQGAKAADHPRGSTLRCTWVEIPQIRHTHAVLLSQPFWMWGAEIGTNEHGVVIGNEAVWTREPMRRSPGLLGMDMVRLGLERGATATEAVEVIVSLIETHGQGGRCGLEDPRFTYHNSFIVADGSSALVLETAGRRWAVEQVQGARSISNGLTIPGFAERYRRPLIDRVARSGPRRQRTEALARWATGAGDMFALLRDHGGTDRSAPDYGLLTGNLGAACQHAKGLLAGSVTTASWVSELSPQAARHWATGTAAPCLGLFKPVDVQTPISTGVYPTAVADSDSLWWRHEALHRRVMEDPATLGALFLPERDALERQWLATPPPSPDAFAEGDRRLEDWTRRVDGHPRTDGRPRQVRHYWAQRNRSARLVV